MKISKNKSAKSDGLLMIAGVALIVWLLIGQGAAPPSSAAPGAAGAGAAAPPSGNTVTLVGAPCTQATTLTVSIVRRYTEVAQGSENATIVQNGVLRGTVAHGSTSTIQSGPNADLMDLYNGLQSTTFYASHTRGKLATCTGSSTTGDPQFLLVGDDEGVIGTPVAVSDTPNHVFQIDTNGNSNWFSIVNDGQANQNTGGQGQSTGANLTIGQGGTGSVSVTFRPGYNSALGPRGGNVLACQYPQAVYDSVAPLQVTFNGVKLNEVSDKKPSAVNYALIGSNNTVRAFAMPGVDGRATPTLPISIVVRADSNHNPAGGLDRVNCTMFDTNYYQRQRDGKYILDIENRDTNADLGATTNPSFEIGVA